MKGCYSTLKCLRRNKENLKASEKNCVVATHLPLLKKKERNKSQQLKKLRPPLFLSFIDIQQYVRQFHRKKTNEFRKIHMVSILM